MKPLPIQAMALFWDAIDDDTGSLAALLRVTQSRLLQMK